MIKHRIRQFEQESKLKIFGMGARQEYWEAAMSKFAELVIKECCDTLAQHGYTDAGKDLKQHFGVEE